MRDFNHITLAGRLSENPRTFSDSGETKVLFTVVVNGKDGAHTPSFIRVTAKGRLADLCKQRLIKNSPVLLHGELHIIRYAQVNGNMGTTAEVVAGEVVFLESYRVVKEVQE